MGVAKDARRGVAVGLLGPFGFGIGVIAQRPFPPLAELTSPATQDRAHDHPVAFAEFFYFRAHFYDFAHEFMADDIPRPHGRDIAPEQVQVRAGQSREKALRRTRVGAPVPGSRGGKRWGGEHWRPGILFCFHSIEVLVFVTAVFRSSWTGAGPCFSHGGPLRGAWEGYFLCSSEGMQRLVDRRSSLAWPGTKDLLY